MCKPASMIIARKNRAVFSAKTDSHQDIIAEFGLSETDRLGEIDLVPVEITPPKGNLSLPLSKWEFGVDYGEYKRELPEWWNADKAEAACRAKLPEWADTRLKGWRLKEAFKPINPFKLTPAEMSRDELLALVENWNSVYASVFDNVYASMHDSVCASVSASVSANVYTNVYASVYASVSDNVYASMHDSVCASVSDNVYASVCASVCDNVYASVCASVCDNVSDNVSASMHASVSANVYAYIGSLFTNIKEWKYLKGVKNPWAALRKLWTSGYVPSFDGKVWRLHAHADARVVFEFTKKEIEQVRNAS